MGGRPIIRKRCVWESLTRPGWDHTCDSFKNKRPEEDLDEEKQNETSSSITRSSFRGLLNAQRWRPQGPHPQYCLLTLWLKASKVSVWDSWETRGKDPSSGTSLNSPGAPVLPSDLVKE